MYTTEACARSNKAIVERSSKSKDLASEISRGCDDEKTVLSRFLAKKKQAMTKLAPSTADRAVVARCFLALVFMHPVESFGSLRFSREMRLETVIYTD